MRGGLVSDLKDLTRAGWVSESKVGKADLRIGMKKIDAAVGKLAVYKESYQYQARIPILEGLQVAIGKWLKTWQNISKRAIHVRDLGNKVDVQLLTDRQAALLKQQQLERARVHHTAFHQMEPDLSEFANRKPDQYKVDDGRFQNIQEGSIFEALTQPRTNTGALTNDSINMMNTIEEKDSIDKIKDISARSKVELGEYKVEQLPEVMSHGTNTNKLTGATKHPELKNLTEPNTEEDKTETTTMDMGGVSWPVMHNKSDVHLPSKLQAVKGAVTKIKERGFAVPVLTLHMPKYGRQITVTGIHAAETGEASERAIFVAPNFLHVSSDALGLPKEDEVKLLGEETKETHINKGYKFSSTVLDPSGAATIVHEIGHAKHYTDKPAKFHGLWGTGFKDSKMITQVTKEVSEYGKSPREFVAEVFLGLVYGRSYKDNLMKAYGALGGPLPDDLAKWRRN